MVKVTRPLATTEPNCARSVYHPRGHARYPTLRPLCRYRTPGPISPTTAHRRHLATPVCPRTRSASFYPPVLGWPTAPPRWRPGPGCFPRLALRTGLRTPTHDRRPPDLLPPGAVRSASAVPVLASGTSGPCGCRFDGRWPRTPDPTRTGRRYFRSTAAATLGQRHGCPRHHRGGGRDLPSGLLPRRSRCRLRLPPGREVC